MRRKLIKENMVQYKIYEIEKARDFWFQDARIKNISTVSFSSSHFFFLKKKKKSKTIRKARGGTSSTFDESRRHK